MHSKSFLFRSVIIALVVPVFIWVGVFVNSYHWWSHDSQYKEPRIIISLKNPNKPYLSDVSPQNVPDPISKTIKSTNTTHNAPTKKSNPKSTDTSAQEESTLLEPSDRVNALIERHYGELFEDLSEGEKAYIINNIITIHRVDRQVGNTLLSEKAPNYFQDGDSNFVEMYLYPDGTVSDITLINQKENAALDELTMETVQMSYASYPRPKQKTLIRLHTRIVRAKNTP
jgi:hypothetical protein